MSFDLVPVGKLDIEKVVFVEPKRIPRIPRIVYSCSVNYKGGPLFMKGPKAYFTGIRKDDHFDTYHFWYYCYDYRTYEQSKEQKNFLANLDALASKLSQQLGADVSPIARCPKNSQFATKKCIIAELIRTRDRNGIGTIFYDSSDEKIDPQTLVDKPGYIQPLFRVKTATRLGMSGKYIFKLSLVEAIYTSAAPRLLLSREPPVEKATASAIIIQNWWRDIG